MLGKISTLEGWASMEEAPQGSGRVTIPGNVKTQAAGALCDVVHLLKGWA